MKMSDMIPFDEDLQRARKANPAFRELWDKNAFAREVSVLIVAYRTKHDLTQADLARMVGVKQPVIARLEIGEYAPSVKTLAKLSSATGLDFHIDISEGSVAVKA